MQKRTQQCVWLVLLIDCYLTFSMSQLGSAWAAGERFKALGDGTVKDQKTGLMWAAQDNGASMNWSTAVEYCKNYSAGGHTDWRMPSSEELASLYGARKKIEGKDYESTIDVVTQSIQITAPWVWTNRRAVKTKAVAYGFNYGVTRRLHRGSGGNRRALPVRSAP